MSSLSSPGCVPRLVANHRADFGHQGGCPVFQKLQNIAAKGAQRALGASAFGLHGMKADNGPSVYDYEGSTTPAYDDGLEVNFPNGNAGVISYADGAYVRVA